MGETTGIAWTDHTFNPWWGCTKVSPGCDHCYAETFDKRVGGAHWGKDAPRRVFGEKHWNEPKKWDSAAAKAGKRARVFCASMADVFDSDAPEGQLERLWALIRETPNLDWQLLTKRPARIARSLPADWGDGYPNVWLGTTVEDQRRAEERVPVLLSVPARVRFLSIEPMLQSVYLDLGRCEDHDREFAAGGHPDFGEICTECATDGGSGDLSYGHWLGDPEDGIQWVIVGGESGGGARVFNLEWARQILRDCRNYSVPCFVKQLGAKPHGEWGPNPPTYHLTDITVNPARESVEVDRCKNGRWNLRDKKGGEPSEWPEDLRVQQFPEAR